MTDGSGNGTPDPPAPPAAPAGPTKDEVQSWVREVLQELKPNDELDKPATLRDVEARARAITEDAMKVLRESPPAGTPPATGSDSSGGDNSGGDGSGSGSGSTPSAGGSGPESSPTNPSDWRDRVRKWIVGD